MKKVLQKKLKNGQHISILGFGGLMLANLDQKQTDETVDFAISSGINFFDVAPTYDEAEVKLGNSLKGKRDKILLSCKTTRRDKKGSLEELNQSRKNLKTDHFDFYIMHGVRDKGEVEIACSKEGMLATAIEAKRHGLVDRIGFSAHTEESAILALNLYDFDFPMFPVNIFCFFSSGFGANIFEIRKKKNIDLIGLKVLALQRWKNNELRTKYPNCWYEPIEDKQIARIALSWAFEQNIVSAIPPADIKMFWFALDLLEDSFSLKLHNSDIESIKLLMKKITPIFS